MEAIILAGGKGTRLRELVSDVPKPMALINGRPFLDIIMRELYLQGFSRVVLSIGYLGDKIKSYFGSKYKSMDIIYVFEDEPLGTGGAVREAMNVCIEDHIYILNGDTFQFVNFVKVEKHWMSSRNPIIIGTMVEDVGRYGALSIHEGKVKGFIEKGKYGPGFINTGYYVLNKAQLNDFPRIKVFSLEHDFLAQQIISQDFDFISSNGGFIDIGVPEDYIKAQTQLREFCQ